MTLTIDLLHKLLNDFGVQTKEWGMGEAKKVDDLLKEILEGESYIRIDENGLVRIVEIVKMFIYDALYLDRGRLLESGQYLPDGRHRQRNQEPSGKVKRGESPEEALVREMDEELGLKRFELNELLAMPSKSEDRASKSYPGLSCLYIVHGFKMVVASGCDICYKDEFKRKEADLTNVFKWEHPGKRSRKS